MKKPSPHRSADLPSIALVETSAIKSSSSSVFQSFRGRERERNRKARLSGQFLSLIPWSLALLLLFAAGTASAQGTRYTLATNGPTTKRINLVFLAEGYTSGQTAKFTNDARAILQQLIATPPFNEYSNYFNAFAIFVASAEAGSDHPLPYPGIFRNTYFNSTYDSYGISYLVTFPPNDYDSTYANGRGKVDALLQTWVPDYDQALLVVNDPAYGGSGGAVLLASTHAASPEIGVHEFGHSFAGLGDEYSTAYPGYPDTEEPNTTRQTIRELIKWNAWILPSTPVPTPNVPGDTRVGLFEGAHYHTTGWFRPKYDCKMNHLNVPFCEVCREAFVQSIYSRVDPIESVSPATNALVRLTNSAAVTLSLTLLNPSTHSLEVQWYVNGVLQPNATNAAFTVTGWSLPPMTNTIRAEVRDPTSFVRTDPQQLLQGSRTWKVQAAEVRLALSINRVGRQISVRWPASAAGCELQSTSDLGPPTSWTGLGVISNQTSATFDASTAPRYFRLRHP